jgi:hypothetical protein
MMPLFHRDPAGKPASAPDGRMVSGLDAYALGQGWRQLGEGPFPDLDSFVRAIVRSRYGAPSYQIHGMGVGPTSYLDAYGGVIRGPYTSPFAGHSFRAANAWTVVGQMRSASVCALELAAGLPVTVIGLRPNYSIMHNLAEVPLGDVDFGARFEVRSQDPERSRDLLIPAVRTLLMGRDDWSFTLTGNEILAVCFTAFESGQDITDRVADLLTLVGAIPESVLAPGLQLRTLPDGTVLDGRNPGRIEAAFAAMTPQQQAEFLADLQRRREQRNHHRPQR